MTDDPVNLDAHRGRDSQKAAEIRRQRQDELKVRLLGATAETWPEAVAKAQYLIDLFASTPRARDLHRSSFIIHALDDLNRLCDHTKEHS